MRSNEHIHFLYNILNGKMITIVRTSIFMYKLTVAEMSSTVDDRIKQRLYNIF